MLVFDKIVTDRLERLGLSVSFALGGRKIVAITGPSGAGKTSLLRGLLGLDAIRSGAIRGADEPLEFGDRATQSQGALWLRKNVRGCMQHVGLWPHLNVQKNLEMTWGRRIRSEHRVFSELLSRLGIAHTLNRVPIQLSGGERKRVGLLRMLGCPATLYCVDEIDSGLDSERKRDVAKIVNEHAVRIPFILVTHDSDFAHILGGGVVAWSEVVTKKQDVEMRSGHLSVRPKTS